jgi:hypothetical protein
MKEIYLINKTKLQKITFRLIIIFFLISLFPSILITSLTLPDRLLLVICLTLLAPFFVFLILSLEYLESVQRKKLYSNLLIEKFLKDYNVIEYIKHSEEKWHLNHISKVVNKDDFYFGVDYNFDLKKKIKIEIFLKHKVISKENLDLLYKEIDSNFQLTFYSLMTNFRIDEINIISKKIEKHIAILKKCDFETNESITKLTETKKEKPSQRNSNSVLNS